ncbi:MAG: hypothetical protein MI920_11100 [Kiloniellales bacterium]|nr:hypothetical protein [Kiloniellales bacterium]
MAIHAHSLKHEKTIRVGTPIDLSLLCRAKIVGRTFEEDPKLDLRTPWGTLNGIPLSVLITMMQPDQRQSEAVEVLMPAKKAAARPMPKLV